MELLWSVPGMGPVSLEFVHGAQRTIVVITHTQGIPDEPSGLRRLATRVCTDVLAPLGVSARRVCFVQAPLTGRSLGVWVQLRFRWQQAQAVAIGARVLDPANALIATITTHRLEQQARASLHTWLLNLAEQPPPLPEATPTQPQTGETHE